MAQYCRRRLSFALCLCASSLGGCAISYIGSDDRIHVLGLASLSSNPEQGQTLAGDQVQLKVYGFWLDTAFTTPFLSIGYGRTAAATLRNAWGDLPGAGAAHAAADGECDGSTDGLWFVACSLPLQGAQNLPGRIVDNSVVGFGIGGGHGLAGNDVFRFALGYSRSVLVTVGGDVLICGDPRTELEIWMQGESRAKHGIGEQCAAA